MQQAEVVTGVVVDVARGIVPIDTDEWVRTGFYRLVLQPGGEYAFGVNTDPANALLTVSAVLVPENPHVVRMRAALHAYEQNAMVRTINERVAQSEEAGMAARIRAMRDRARRVREDGPLDA